LANTNTTSNIVNTIFAQGLVALREMAVMPRFVNLDYSTQPGQRGSTIQISVPAAITTGNVTPSNTPPDDTGITPTAKTITLDQWKEAPFFLNDKEILEIDEGFANKQITESIRSLANTVDSAILALYTKVYGYGGAAGTTPFANDYSEFTTARAALNRQLAPKTPDRYCVVDEDAEANAVNLRPFTDKSYRGNGDTLLTGEIGRILGAMWAMDQNVPTHTAGTASGATTDNTGYALGIKTVTLASAGTGTILVGDIITFAGDTQTYTVVTGDADVSGGGTVVFEPGLKVAIAASTTAITVKSSHVCNMLFNRDAFALATRPAEASDALNLANRRSMVDPVSGLALTLEVSRQHYRTRYAFSILYGVLCVRPEFAARIAG
jgi:hypothetical protein